MSGQSGDIMEVVPKNVERVLSQGQGHVIQNRLTNMMTASMRDVRVIAYKLNTVTHNAATMVSQILDQYLCVYGSERRGIIQALLNKEASRFLYTCM